MRRLVFVSDILKEARGLFLYKSEAHSVSFVALGLCQRMPFVMYISAAAGDPMQARYAWCSREAMPLKKNGHPDGCEGPGVLATG